MSYLVKDWSSFQHYKDRNPPWVKLHKSLLDNFDFQSLPVDSRALAPMLWLLASEHKDPNSGQIDLPIEAIAFRLRQSEKYIKLSIKPLIDKGFIVDSSNMLAECKQLAVPETETETETETKTELRDFEKLWEAWEPFEMVKGNKQIALKSYLKNVPEKNREEALASAIEYCACCRSLKTKTKHVVTWINQGGWREESEKEKDEISVSPEISLARARLSMHEKNGVWLEQWPSIDHCRRVACL
jgi:hypothetical protein